VGGLDRHRQPAALESTLQNPGAGWVAVRTDSPRKSMLVGVDLSQSSSRAAGWVFAVH